MESRYNGHHCGGYLVFKKKKVTALKKTIVCWRKVEKNKNINKYKK